MPVKEWQHIAVDPRQNQVLAAKVKPDGDFLAAAAEAVELRANPGREVTNIVFSYRETDVVVDPKDDPDAVADKWRTAANEKHTRWLDEVREENERKKPGASLPGFGGLR